MLYLDIQLNFEKLDIFGLGLDVCNCGVELCKFFGLVIILMNHVDSSFLRLISRVEINIRLLVWLRLGQAMWDLQIFVCCAPSIGLVWV